MTFLLNTDGASICNKSGLTVWPVYLVVNELSNRFSLENVILAGIHLYPEKDVYCAVYVYSIHIHVHVHQIHENDVYYAVYLHEIHGIFVY